MIILDFLGILSFFSMNAKQNMNVDIIIPIIVAVGENKNSYRSVGDYK